MYFEMSFTSQETLLGDKIKEAKMTRFLGQEVAVIYNGYRTQGNYTTIWNGMNKNGILMPSGIYLVEINNFKWNELTKMVHHQAKLFGYGGGSIFVKRLLIK